MPACAVAALVSHGINSECPSFPASKPSPRGLTGGISTVRKAAIPPWQQSADVNLVADVRARQPRTPAIAAADSATPHHTGDHR
eukprot:CAMPEP_0203977698 /NCGR_PEP_ID=MMETSP0359-20131031/101744_1 /ASSEMBLY_ACC=CAM_ASM_000338 /TAXON_ID=268821 /ORGANISM="Scrippsiella Hangoei, Strain SHTV-5" /LENGTH=83 /DNA_ID=CAMNT_0050915907 /DNA_START=810 /DNA_END=1061 /DNA_ORIENTATION=-